MTLHDLLNAAEINNWDRRLWFKDADLKGDVLVVQDTTSARFIASCWREAMQRHVPGLRILVADSPARVSTRQPETRKSIWKVGKDPRPSRLGGID